MQLLKVADDEKDQYVVEFKNKDYGSQRLFYEAVEFMKGTAETVGLKKYQSKA